MTLYEVLLKERIRRWPPVAYPIFQISDEERLFHDAIGEEWAKLSDEERTALGAQYICFSCGRRTKQGPQIVDKQTLPAYCSEDVFVQNFLVRVKNALGETT